QMGIMIIFALSYNMQMGQSGLLSFGHAVFLGLGGYVTAHALNAATSGTLPVPLELTPLAGGLGGLAFAILFGYFATKQRATAFRDTFERAQFVGYVPRMVRFVQFSLSGFFAGIAGALYTLTYEIVTYDTVSGAMSANALLMTYIGGVGVFAGPVIGAVLVVLLQSWVSLLSNSWLVYAGVLFILMVTFAPGGIGGLVMMHQPIWRARGLGRLAGPYLRLLVPGLLVAVGFVLVIELCSFLTIGAAQGKTFTLSR